LWICDFTSLISHSPNCNLFTGPRNTVHFLLCSTTQRAIRFTDLVSYVG